MQKPEEEGDEAASPSPAAQQGTPAAVRKPFTLRKVSGQIYCLAGADQELSF